MCAECENYLLGGACLPACPPGYYPAISRTLGQILFRVSREEKANNYLYVSRYSLGFVFVNVKNTLVQYLVQSDYLADLSKS
jgi:hypothetical protein